MITNYEKQIQFLEENKIILREKIANCGRPIKDFDETFRTAKTSLPINMLGGILEGKSGVVGPAGLEPATGRL